MKPDRNINGPWELHCYSGSDYAGDNGTWKSVTEYNVSINRTVITWRSKIQKTVTLYVT